MSQQLMELPDLKEHEIACARVGHGGKWHIVSQGRTFCGWSNFQDRDIQPVDISNENICQTCRQSIGRRIERIWLPSQAYYAIYNHGFDPQAMSECLMAADFFEGNHYERLRDLAEPIRLYCEMKNPDVPLSRKVKLRCRFDEIVRNDKFVTF